MFEDMHKLLGLTARTYTTAAAKANYRKIISMVHPDKYDSDDATRISSAVIYAYHTLKDPHKRYFYEMKGQPGNLETYDNKEARKVAKMIELISFGRREAEKEANNNNKENDQTETITIDSEDDDSNDMSEEDRESWIQEDEVLTETNQEDEYQSSAKENESFDAKGNQSDKRMKDAATSPIKFAEKRCSCGETTRTENNPEQSKRRSSHKQQIVKIISVRTRDGRMRFKVRWSPGGQETTEDLAIVLEERQGLSKWLDEMEINQPRKFNAILKFHPEIKRLWEKQK